MSLKFMCSSNASVYTEKINLELKVLQVNSSVREEYVLLRYKKGESKYPALFFFILLIALTFILFYFF